MIQVVEEQEYRSTYRAVNQRRCVFEKTINSRRGACEQSARFCLADREGVACKSDAGNSMCTKLLDDMRRNARFSLHLTRADGPLPHAREIRVQVGGLLGLQKQLHPDTAGHNKVGNIYGLVKQAIERYGSTDSLPFDLIVQEIVSFRGRRKRLRPRK